MQLDFTVLGLKGVKIISFQEENKYLKVILEKDSSSENCPTCKTPSSSIKDHHIHPIFTKSIESLPLQLLINKRRFLLQLFLSNQKLY